MHQPDNFDLNNNFHTCRGLASYVENFRGLTLGVDLLASMYAGYKAHAQMAAICGDSVTARNDLKKADAYQNIIEDNGGMRNISITRHSGPRIKLFIVEREFLSYCGLMQ